MLPRESVEVLFAGALSAEESSELVRAFGEVGLTVHVREVAPRRSLGDIAWLALVALPLKPFFEELVKNAAGDAYTRLSSLTGTIFRRHRPAPTHPAVLVLQDATTGVQVVIEPDLPQESYQQLVGFDLSTISHGPLHYDRHQHWWRSELDDAAASPPTP